MQPGSSGRDVRGQEAVDVTDDVQRKSSGTTRASPALAHGADEGLTLMKEQSDVAVSMGNEDGNSVASASQIRSAADDQLSTKNSHHSVRLLKHKNDWSYKYGTGSADLHRASSLQDFTNSAAERSQPSAAENMVSCGCTENGSANDVHHLHGMLMSSDACSTDPGCASCDRSSTTDAGELSVSSPSRSRCRMRRSATNLELESVGSTGIVSNTARFWEGLVDSSSSVARCGMRPRHVSEDRRRFMRPSLRYSTVSVPCDIQTLHDVVCMPSTASKLLSQPEALHVNGDREVCFCFCFCVFIYLCYGFVACLCA